MDKNDFESKAERYKQEMLRLYGRSTVPKVTDETDVEQAAEDSLGEEYDVQPEDIEEIADELPDDTAFAPHTDEEESEDGDEETDYNSRYPEPDLSGLDIDGSSVDPVDSDPPEYASEESLGSSVGYILVNVRTGDESAAVVGATVMVTAVIDGKRMILASGLTNENGTAQKFSLPVPELVHSQSPSAILRPYNLFDVSVTAEGFFNARSVDVPVFSGITSVQNFNMIPVPLMMQPYDETVTICNSEPDFPSSADQGG